MKQRAGDVSAGAAAVAASIAFTSIAAAQGQCGDILWCDGLEHYARGRSPIGQDCAAPSECDPVRCAPDCCPEALSWRPFWEDPKHSDALVVADPVEGDNAMALDAPDPSYGIVDDVVHTFGDLDIDPSGSFTFRVDVFVPDAYVETPDEDVWVMLFNKFEPNGAKSWATQLHFNSTSQTIISDFDDNATPFETGAWGELRVNVDLVRDTQRVLWNDDLIVEKSWVNGVSKGGIRDLQALNLFAGTSAVPLYFDGFRVTQGGDAGVCAPTRCEADLDYSRDVGFEDLLLLLSAWGPYEACPPFRREDLDASCAVDFGDLLQLLAAWGPC